jgi:hypothetical protein
VQLVEIDRFDAQPAQRSIQGPMKMIAEVHRSKRNLGTTIPLLPSFV